MDKKFCKRLVNAIAYQASHTGGIVLFPLSINGQRHLDRPARQGAGWQQNAIANGLIAGATTIKHAGQHWDIKIGVVVDLNHSFSFVEAMKAAHILCDSPTP